MTKNELVIAVAEACELSKKDAEAAVNAIVESTINALKNGEEVKFSGFGTFAVKTRAKRTGTIPGTDKRIEIPASKTVGFKASKSLKELVK
ncbi:MAG: HU family DNA-binding protein [Erysipelotrichaceae bacterium]|jgi:DNA-binding protein HU-beta|nr:HU family DNA-binding protein [Erysipelotrichaceae bacterium]MCB9499969.1 HU family DNA-binding protein [Erysipelotrichaceae bacterium]